MDGPGSSDGDVLDVVVVGAGAAGLAAAAELTRRGKAPVVLESSGAVGQRWRERYDRLHLHTVRRHSGLPGTPIPREAGRFVAAVDFARYLEDYSRRHAIDVRLRSEVAAVGPAEPLAGARWNLALASGTGLKVRTVVIATGRAAQPVVPSWPGSEAFAGRLLHSSDYRNARAFVGRRVLVVGAGNSGGEIAVDLAESGASWVDLAVRTPPHIVRREIGRFWSSQQSGILLGRLPTGVLDAVSALQTRLTIPDLTSEGLPRPRVGLATRLLRDGVIPLQDVGLIAAIRRGVVHVRPAVIALQPEGADFSDGTTGTYDAIVAATGFASGLETLIANRAVLTAGGLPRTIGGRPAAPGLYFVGYSITLGGALRDAGADARRVALAIAREDAAPVETARAPTNGGRWD
jgi:putative flavoprotein involved in K+ transport